MLAIVLPAYKPNFLRDTLQSIADQTNKNFHLYVGDDNSPAPLEEIVKQFEDEIPLTFVRFNENLGNKSLTKQWERCIELSKNEPYIWLFSDDDIMPPDAVERFYETLESNTNQNYLYRFNLMAIDGNSNSLYNYKPKPSVESNYNFAISRLKGKYLSSAVEFIFRRDVYLKHDGFVEFPHAWCSDDATWIRFSEESGIYTIPGEPVFWRVSGSNISANKSYALTLSPVLYIFSGWLINYFKPKLNNQSFHNSILFNIYRQTIQLGFALNRADIKKINRLFCSHFGILGYYASTIALLNLYINLLKQKLFKLIK